MQVPGLPNHKTQSQEIPQAPRQVMSNEPSGQGPAISRSDASGGPVHTRSADMQRLAAELSRAPEVRDDKVALATERLASGYYQTRAAARATAEHLLNSPE